MNFPDGYIVKTSDPMDSFLIYGEMNDSGHVAKGFRLHVPNLSYAGNEQKNVLYNCLVSYLAMADVNKRIQIKYERDSDYSDILRKYEADTDKYAREMFPKRVRGQIAEEVRKKIEKGDLKREYLYLYLSKPLRGFMPGSFDPTSKKERARFEAVVSDYFKNEFITLQQAFPFEVEKLDHEKLFKHFYRAANKSAIEHDIDYKKRFSPFFRDCYENDYAGLTENLAKKAVSFTGDGYLHNILVLDRFPAFDLFPFFGNSFIWNGIQNLSITVNLMPLAKDKTIDKLQKQQNRTSADVQAKPTEIALKAEVDALKDTIYRMGSGEDVPYNVEFIFHVWSKTLEQLQADTSCLKQIALNMQSPLYMHENGAQSLAIFLKTFPGNVFYKKWNEALLGMHRSFAAMIPFNSSFTGVSDDFQAIFDGDSNNLVCINPFFNNTPQHSAMFGQSGAGKSVNALGLLLQVYPFYSKIVIIEEGASYLMLTRILNGEFIEIDVNGNLCLNYFDTCKTPLMASQTEFVVNFLVCMCGHSKDDEIIQDRAAIMTHYVTKAYQFAFLDWKATHVEILPEIARKALTIEWMIPNQPSGRNTTLDCFFDLRDALEKAPAGRNTVEKNIVEHYESLSELKVNEFIMESPTLLRDIAYAYMEPEHMPYHSQIVEMIRSTPESFHNRQDTDRIATRLAQYAIESGKGCLFDGVTNINLSNRLIHFELGKMANSSSNFKSMIGLVIGNLVKNQITNMPRIQKKMYIFEEAQRFLSIPGGDAIMKQSYAQFRKFNCVAWTITQEAGQLMEGGDNGSNVGTIVMGQSKQYYFLKNKDKKNLAAFLQYARLSDDTQKAIMEFPSPESIPGRKYSSYVYYVDNGEYPIVGVVRHYATALAIAVASTSGAAFSRREGELRKLKIMHPDLSNGELLLLYLEREKLDNPALRLIGEMHENKDLTKIEELKEAIYDLSIKLLNKG